MATPYRFELSYILMLPFNPAIDPGQTISAPVPKDAPYFYELNIQYQKLNPIQKHVGATVVQVQPQVLNREVWAAECVYELPSPLDPAAIALRRTVNAALRKDFLDSTQYKGRLIEEYTILLISGGQGQQSPDDFVRDNSTLIAQLLRSSDRPPEDLQTEHILQSRTRYSAEDLTIIDWEGGLILSPNADFRTEIDLLKIGNYHLLKYRLVDEQIDSQLHELRILVGKSFSWFSNKREILQKVVDSRLGLMLDFENTDQSILLIGDWYPAQIYRIIFDEFYIDEWKTIVSGKLENLSSITESVQQNLTISWSRLLDLVQLVGWFLVLLGYVFLFLRDAKVIK